MAARGAGAAGVFVSRASILARLDTNTGLSHPRNRLSRWLSSATAAYFSIQLLQAPLSTHASLDTIATTTTTATKPEYNPVSGQTATTPTKPTSPPQAGRTLDLTLFAATRALDVIIGELWSRRRTHLPPTSLARARPIRTLDRLLSHLTDPIIFALTSGIVMWNWFYSPQSLPRAYNKWIASAAAVDERLVIALQRCRSQDIRYGEDTGQAPLLQSLCEDYRFPLAWGDPAISVPFPCEMVHVGAGPVCEVYALIRFRRAWLWSMKTYVPLQLFVFLLRVRSSTNLKRDLLRTMLSASRSSAFLGAFITLFYYSICLARTRVGPLVLGKSVEARQKIDGGICVGMGCFLCGWSILLETASRRKELALFVAPRAVATLLPRRYGAEKQWIERVVFAASTAVVFTCVLENKTRVRGVVGGVLRMLLAA